MPEWWTYELSDFLLFSHRVYVRLFELHNADLWPAHVATLAAGAGMLHAIVAPSRYPARFVPLVLGAIWIGIAWAFFWQRYATINWAAPYVAPLFAFEGLLLIAAGARSGYVGARKVTATGVLVPAVIVALCLFAYPLMPLLLGRPLAAGEAFGIAPDPTAAATLAVLATWRGRSRWLLMIVPAVWTIVTGLTLWTMGAPEALVTPAMAIAACGYAVVRRADA